MFRIISESEIINQPYSGKYKEIIFDIKSKWNSSNWTYVKFIEEDFYEWCGVFRGSSIGVSLSNKHNRILVLTSDYLYEINSLNGKLIAYQSNDSYKNLTVDDVSGDFIISDNYTIEIILMPLNNKILIESPIKMDMIEFISWSSNKLKIVCDEWMNWDNKLYLELDMGLRKIEILSSEIQK